LLLPDLAGNPARQVIGLGIQLVGNLAQPNGEIGSTLRYAPQFDSGHLQKCNRVLDGSAELWYSGADGTTTN
jgi:hypothetical protein